MYHEDIHAAGGDMHDLRLVCSSSPRRWSSTPSASRKSTTASGRFISAGSCWDESMNGTTSFEA